MTNRIKWSGPFTGLDGVIRAEQAEKEGLLVEYTYGYDTRTRKDPLICFHKDFDYYIGEEVKPREWWVNVSKYVVKDICFPTEGLANNYAEPDRLECIHMREVIE